jgi:hypothetical protein
MKSAPATWLDASSVVQQLSEQVILYDLSQIRGTRAILSRIPESASGVYAWYRRFDLHPDAIQDPEVFESALLKEIYKPHFATREARLPPSTKLTVEAETTFSKQEVLHQLSQDISFRQIVCMLLQNSLLFQQPLYIGRAKNIQRRIRSHLSQESSLRKRPASSNHDLDQCKLLVIITTESLEDHYDSSLNLEDEEEQELPKEDSEKLIEDILSRLFLPSFTIRYG